MGELFTQEPLQDPVDYVPDIGEKLRDLSILRFGALAPIDRKGTPPVGFERIVRPPKVVFTRLGIPLPPRGERSSAVYAQDETFASTHGNPDIIASGGESLRLSRWLAWRQHGDR